MNDWHDNIGDPTLADAILDRLIHRMHRIHREAKESMREREAASHLAKPKAGPRPRQIRQPMRLWVRPS